MEGENVRAAKLVNYWSAERTVKMREEGSGEERRDGLPDVPPPGTPPHPSPISWVAIRLGSCGGRGGPREPQKTWRR